MIEKYLRKYRNLTIRLLEADYDSNEDEVEKMLAERSEILSEIEALNEKPSSNKLLEEIIELDNKLVNKTEEKMLEIAENIKKVRGEKSNLSKNLNMKNKYSTNSTYQESIYFDQKSK